MKPAGREELWAELRAVEPPPEAKSRGRARLAAELESPRRPRRVFVPVLAVACVLTAGTSLAAVGVRAWLAAQARDEPSAVGAHVVRGSHAALPSAAPGAPEVPRAAPPVAPGAEVPLATAVLAETPAPLVTQARGQHAPRPAAAEASKSAASPGELSEQVTEYRRIAAMGNREASLAGWRGMLRRWPRTTLRHEIELNIVDALGRLGRRAEAREAATAFLRRYPASPRAADMKRLLAPASP